MNAYLSAVALVIPDYKEALAFYVDKAGFVLVEDTDLGNGKRWVLIAPSAGAQTHILLARAEGGTQLGAVGNQAGGRVGFFLDVDDFDARFDAMRNAGVVFEEAPRHEAYGKVAVWRDPWGNRWDLLERR